MKKKFLALTFIVIMMINLVACGNSQTSTVGSNDTPPESQSSSMPEPTSEPTPEPTPEPAKPVLVFEDDKVKIHFVKLTEKGVVFEVENLTDVNITVQADSISINKKSINDIIMSADVAPQSIGEVVARCSVDPSTNVATIGGQLRIVDFSESFESYDASFINITVNENAINEDENVSNSNTLVFEDDKVKIHFVKLTEKGVVFEVENLTDVNITVQADSISINKKSINDIIMSADVAPQSIGEVVARCSVDPSTNVETIGGQLRIVDFSESFESYDASFINIAVQ